MRKEGTMKRKIPVIFLLLAVLVTFAVSCKGNEDAETTGGTEESKDEVTVETPTDTNAPQDTTGEPENTETDKVTDTEKVTETDKETGKVTDKQTEKDTDKETNKAPQGGTETNQGIGGGSLGGSVVSRPGKDTGSKDTSSSKEPDKTEPDEPVKVPDGYILTHRDKLVVKTVSDRSVDKKEDNSTKLPYEKLKSSVVKTDPEADYNRVKLRLEHMRPGVFVQGVLIGYDGYMFYKDTLNDFVGDGFLATSIYNRAVKDMKERNDWAKSTGRKFYYVIAPNKNSIYSDYMPEGYELAKYRRYDQFCEMLTEAGITPIDLRKPLIEAREKNPKQNLYYRYDTHWNNHAGYVAYRHIMSVLKKDYPNVVIHDKSEYQINYCETYMKDMAYYLGQYDAMKDYGPVYTLKSGKTARFINLDRNNVKGGQYTFAHVYKNGYSDKWCYYRFINDYNKNAPNIYVMRDSYNIALVPFFKDSFHKSTYNWTFAFEENKIDEAEADIVMVIVAERFLRNCINYTGVVD